MKRRATSPGKRSAVVKGAFVLGEIVSMDYDDLHPERYEPGTVVGVVVRIEGDRMKVVYAAEGGAPDFSWFARHEEAVPRRWIDTSYSAIVNVEEASISQRDDFNCRVPRDRQLRLIKHEQVGPGKGN